MVPEGWERKSYGDIAELNRQSLKGKTDPNKKIRYLDIAAVTSTGVVSEPIELTFGKAPSRARRIVASGDTIVSTVRPYLRAFAYIEDACENLVASTGFCSLTPKEQIDAKYLYQTILSGGFVASLMDKMKGSNYPSVNPTDISELTLLLPPLPEQKIIATILGSVDESIQATQAVIDQTRKVKQGLLQQLLTRGIGHTRFKQTAIGEIPEGWEVLSIGDLFEVQLGKMLSPKAKGGDDPKPYLGNSNVKWGQVSFDTALTMDFSDREKEKFRLRSGDLLLCEGGEVGRAAIWRDEPEEMYYQKALHRLRPVADQMLPEYMFQYLVLNFQLRDTFAAERGVTSIAHLPRVRLLKIPVSVPPLEEQKEIVRLLGAVGEAISAEQTKKKTLIQMKVGLMQDLLTGRVRVGEVECK